MNSIKKISAWGAVVCGVIFTIVGLLSIWEVGMFGPLGSGISNKLMPSFGLLTAAFLVLLIILKVVEEKN